MSLFKAMIIVFLISISIFIYSVNRIVYEIETTGLKTVVEQVWYGKAQEK